MSREILARVSDKNKGSEKDLLNVAAVSTTTHALGPGIRAAVWVQGCTIHCPGCIAPDWIPVKPAHLVDPELLADELLSNPQITGLTLSGGEPMLQAAALARLVYKARQIRDIDVICFSGFRLQMLLKNPPNPGVEDLLHRIDVLIDGPYLDLRNDNLGLRGSSNQQIHHISDRLKGFDFDHANRKVEIEVLDGQAFMIGIPTRSSHFAFSKAVDQARQLPVRMVSHERA
jgi:anaerobic ribonucleoside-triphosphate reductase activating protein